MLKLLGKDDVIMGTELLKVKVEDLAKQLDSNLTDGDVSYRVQADSSDQGYRL